MILHKSTQLQSNIIGNAATYNIVKLLRHKQLVTDSNSTLCVAAVLCQVIWSQVFVIPWEIRNIKTQQHLHNISDIHHF